MVPFGPSKVIDLRAVEAVDQPAILVAHLLVDRELVFRLPDAELGRHHAHAVAPRLAAASPPPRAGGASLRSAFSFQRPEKSGAWPASGKAKSVEATRRAKVRMATAVRRGEDAVTRT